jgi:hypothetical protein
MTFWETRMRESGSFMRKKVERIAQAGTIKIPFSIPLLQNGSTFLEAVPTFRYFHREHTKFEMHPALS